MSPSRVDTRDYRRAGQSLRGADAAIKREFTRALRDAGKPYGQYVLVAGAQRLPRRGGLNYRVASGRVTVQVSTMRASITLRTKEGDALRGFDQGQLRHPVFARNGRRRRWVRQSIEQGVFSKPFEDNAGSARTAMLAAGQRVLDQLAEGLR